MVDARAQLDNLAWDKNDEAWEISQKRLRRRDTCELAASLAGLKFGGKATFRPPLIIGGYNILYKVQVEGMASDVYVRLPCPDWVQFPIEKTLQEGATARYVEQHTQIPVPKVFDYGEKSDLGPFMILQHVENSGLMVNRIKMPNLDPDVTSVLDPNISETVLSNFYGKAARCLLQISRLSFDRIGSLSENDSNSFSVTGRPLSKNMNDMLQLANIPRAVLPPENKTYSTTDEWYVALVEMHMAQLIFQHNDLVTTENDCRNKYVARQLFRRLAKDHRLSSFGFADDGWSAQSKSWSSQLSRAPSNLGPFRLWADDFRPGNILVDDSDDIVAVIDWELTYAGPTQFMLDCPWWLLLEVPESWKPDMDDWTKIYEIRLQTWLSAMEKAEKDTGSETLPFVLSTHMRESWETGRFWLNYAAKNSWAFDTVFWKYLDEKFFGIREVDVPKDDLWRTRVNLLSEKERAAMEPFVQWKMEDKKERILVDWDPEEAKQRLSEALFD
ncbi:phosphotransferase [Calycina marina]|uniref:Phosphotransferase n=1 Tax=Calycina marina TaxID=1763456 RepID=A0A9P7Z3P4_9HELO|nr:phosphotransferase [Calycina marina]